MADVRQPSSLACRVLHVRSPIVRTLAPRWVEIVKSAFALIATATLLGSLAIYGTASERASQPSSGAKGADTRGTLSARVADAYAKLPLSFEANQGQADAQVQFLARGPGYGLFLTSTEAVLSLRQASGQPARLGRGHSALLDTTT